jgi:hypothetical protein
MGSGSISGAGGGGSGVGGSSGNPSWRSWGIGKYIFRNRRTVSKEVKNSKIKKELHLEFRKLGKSREYLLQFFLSPLAEKVYLTMHDFYRRVTSGDPESAPPKFYGISSHAGFIPQLVEYILVDGSKLEPNVKVREVVRMTVEDFLLTAIGNDPELYVDGSYDQVMTKLDLDFFRYTSNNFLGSLIWHILAREIERMQPASENKVREQCRQLGEKIAIQFNLDFLGDSGKGYERLFGLLREKPEWILKELFNEK